MARYSVDTVSGASIGGFTVFQFGLSSFVSNLVYISIGVLNTLKTYNYYI